MTAARHRGGGASDGRPRTNPHAEWITREEFEHLVKDFYGTRTVMFDKAMAEVVLGYNTGNRRVTRRKLEALSRQMSSGEFENTGEPIILSAEGVLNNGQHRLLAVVEADAVVDMDVRFGIPRRAFTKTDTGAPRTGGDVLTIKGTAHGGQVASAVRLLILYRRGLPDSIRDFVSNDEVARAFDRWKDIADVVQQVQGFSFPKSVRSTLLYAAAYLASRSQGKAKLPQWLYTLATGLDAGRDNPAYQLRERLLRGIEAPIGTREGLLERFALMIKAWNLYVAGKTVSMREFRWKASGKGAEPFPQVEGARLGAYEGAG
ncbi:hypothetical protein [Limobrevibacterium gyesilva]|uniref:Uncharacterized protein n=1 Tax=Limobrevibacterium gyesilva TaxID=2991712 RepID=A0AA41YWX2_9PROT|nr:hypothetical protein [Limobrevibacterium gyesilva]MCW3477880.1 hypothetical protein [Limobrevibacterium gyesilva]